jgi:hypothetical protein
VSAPGPADRKTVTLDVTDEGAHRVLLLALHEYAAECEYRADRELGTAHPDTRWAAAMGTDGRAARTLLDQIDMQVDFPGVITVTPPTPEDDPLWTLDWKEGTE